jgi:sugar-specific transcriptional regulator TrmB
MKTIKHPYEVLIRGNHENHVVAAHVIYAVTIIHDDGTIQVAPGQPEACSPENLADVLDPLIAEPLTQIQAIRDEYASKIQELETALESSRKELQETVNQNGKLIATRDEALFNLGNLVSELQAEIALRSIKMQNQSHPSVD